MYHGVVGGTLINQSRESVRNGAEVRHDRFEQMDLITLVDWLATNFVVSFIIIIAKQVLDWLIHKSQLLTH